MVDPISISSGIAGLLSLAITVAEKSYQYASSVRSASATIASYLRELSALKGILFKLNELTESPNAVSRLANTNSATLLSTMDIAECQGELERILAKMQKRSGGSALGVLTWPFVEHDIKSQINMLQRYNRLFHMALSADAYAVGSLTLQEVTALRVDTQEEKSSSRQKAIVNWLFPDSFDDTHAAVRSRRQADTGLWFLDAVQSWLAEPKFTSIFWSRGIPGAGKTILMSGVVDYIESECRRGSVDGFAYIYFNYKQQGSQTIFSIFASLVAQLLPQSYAIQDLVEKLFDKNQGGKKKADLEELVNILTSIPPSSKIILAFDALDEASQATRKALMSHLSKAKQEHILVFVTSRPDVDVRCLAGKIRIFDVIARQSDMKTFIRARLESSEDILEILADNTEYIIQKIISAITERAEGMFILVTFQIDFICEQTSAKEILSALQVLPSESGLIYMQTLEQIDAQSKSQVQLARKVLCWLILAKSRLTIPELIEALAIEADRTELDPLNRSSGPILVKVCRGLVVVDENSMVIRLAHLTVHDFLVEHLPELSQMREEIALACVTYISFDAFKTGPCVGAKQFRSRLGEYAFYRYACLHCAEHLEDLFPSEYPSICNKLIHFTTSKTLSDSYLQVRYSSGIDSSWSWYPRMSLPLHIAAYLGVSHVASQLLEEHHGSLDTQNSHFSTPLHCAIEQGHKAVVETFLEHGVTTEYKEGNSESALNCAARNGRDDIVRLFLEKSMTSGGRHSKQEQDLFVAAVLGDLEAIKQLIQTGVNVHVTDSDGGTAMQWASWYGHTSVVLYLLEAGSAIEASDANGRRALHEAAERDNDGVVRVLLQYGADINAQDSWGYTPLHRASLAETSVVASILLAHGVELSHMDAEGNTALHIAAISGRVECVRLLMDNGFDVQDFRIADIDFESDVTPEQRLEIIQMISQAQTLPPSYEVATSL